MFSATQDQKPIPRTALYTLSSSSASPEPEVEERLHAHLARLYSPSIAPITTTTGASSSETPPNPSAPDEAQSYEFRLFSNPNPTTQSSDLPTQKVVIRSPTPPPKDAVGGFVIPHRPRSYYFSDDDATAEKKRRSRKREEFKDAGVSGEDVLERSRAPWPGSLLPWRVVTLHFRLPPRHRLPLPSPSLSSLPVNAQHDRRKRPGKKRRLALYKTLAARRALVTAREMSTREREVAEREKRTRRNREKKVKRKIKGKEAKTKERREDAWEGEGGILRDG